MGIPGVPIASMTLQAGNCPQPVVTGPYRINAPHSVMVPQRAPVQQLTPRSVPRPTPGVSNFSPAQARSMSPAGTSPACCSSPGWQQRQLHHQLQPPHSTAQPQPLQPVVYREKRKSAGMLSSPASHGIASEEIKGRSISVGPPLGRAGFLRPPGPRSLSPCPSSQEKANAPRPVVTPLPSDCPSPYPVQYGSIDAMVAPLPATYGSVDCRPADQRQELPQRSSLTSRMNTQTPVLHNREVRPVVILSSRGSVEVRPPSMHKVADPVRSVSVATQPASLPSQVEALVAQRRLPLRHLELREAAPQPKRAAGASAMAESASDAEDAVSTSFSPSTYSSVLTAAIASPRFKRGDGLDSSDPDEESTAVEGICELSCSGSDLSCLVENLRREHAQHLAELEILRLRHQTQSTVNEKIRMQLADIKLQREQLVLEAALASERAWAVKELRIRQEAVVSSSCVAPMSAMRSMAKPETSAWTEYSSTTLGTSSGSSTDKFATPPVSTDDAETPPADPAAGFAPGADCIGASDVSR